MLLAYTTANDTRPIYRRDCLNAVAFPAGWTISLSYRSKWIAPDLVAAVEENGLTGSELLLVVVRGKRLGKHPERYVPLRHCKILKTDMIGESLAVVHLETARRPSEELVRHFHDHAQERQWPVPIWGGDHAGLSHYLHRVPRESLARPEETSFDSHVEALKECIEPESCRYFMITRLFKVKPSRALVPPTVATSLTLRQPGASELTVLDLRPGELYNLEVLVHRDSLAEGGGSPLEFKIRGEQVDIAEPLLRQYGTGALVSYLIAVNRQYASELATLAIRTGQTADAKSRPSAEAQVLLQIKPSLRFWLLALVLVLFGTIGFEATKEALEDLKVAHAALWVMGAKLAGTGLLAWAAWWLFRSVPIKPG
jgi:hypothetical protein